MTKKIKTYSLTDKLDFGKYKGWILRDVIVKDLNYIKWCIEKNENFEMIHDAKRYFDRALLDKCGSQSDDCYWFLSDKSKFIDYLVKNAEDAVFLDPSIFIVSDAEQLEFQF